MAAIPLGTWLCAGVGQRPGPSAAASLSLISGSRTSSSSVSLKVNALKPNSPPPFLHCSFLSASSSLSSSSASSFSGKQSNFVRFLGHVWLFRYDWGVDAFQCLGSWLLMLGFLLSIPVTRIRKESQKKIEL
ncbi:unnamed protein product [Cuscuta campestris]|uniref:Uncharacterized protein n=1 Tax=Cuscuta campestris TaxID=132261 RepID=A0A484MJV2_9ASTE|nr:unnamed protein product [Cuscuta campestris]